MNPLILLHGALGAKEQLIPLKENLEKNISGLDVHILNFSGHGGVDYPKDGFSIKNFAQDLKNYLEKNQIDKADIFGYSMGGYVALQLALDSPETIGSIFTLGTKFDWTLESATRETKMLNADVIEIKLPKFAQILKKRHAPMDWRQVLSKTAEMMVELGNTASLSTSDLTAIEQSIMITVGAADNMVTIDESKNAAKILPNASFKVLEGQPHPIEKVDVELITEELILFLGNKHTS